VPKPKAVVDTSVFVAGMLSKSEDSSPVQIINLWRAGAFTLVMAPAILREIVATFSSKGIEDDIVVDFIRTTAKIALNIPGAYESTRLDHIDATDNKFLAAAVESSADFIVSLDKKSLLPMKHYHRTQIVTPELFMRQLLLPSDSEDPSFTATMDQLDADLKISST
jgi:putative PIN family toxin of toxin-antitoxin system